MENKSMKVNLNNAIKTILDQRITIETNLKEFINQLVENSESGIRGQLKMFESDISATKIENGKYHLEAMKKVKDIKDEFSNFMCYKEEILDEVNKEKTERKKFNSELEKEFKKYDSSFVEINESIVVSR